MMNGMSDDYAPEPQPFGDLSQPPRKPPTAIALATPEPAPEHRRPSAVRRAWYEDVLTRTLDVVDELGDAVAEALHIRPRRRESGSSNPA